MNYCDYSESFPKAIIVKCDDDIVFMDLLKLDSFLQVMRSNTSFTGVLFPNIVNNGVAAYIQQKHLQWWPVEETGLDFEYPPDGLEGSLWESGQKAYQVHDYFLNHWREIISNKAQSKQANRLEGSLIPIETRFSINMFAIRSRDWCTIRNIGDDDEFHLSVTLVKMGLLENFFMTDFIVSHFSFFKQQDDPWFQEHGEKDLLLRYQALFEEYKQSIT